MKIKKSYIVLCIVCILCVGLVSAQKASIDDSKIIFNSSEVKYNFTINTCTAKDTNCGEATSSISLYEDSSKVTWGATVIGASKSTQHYTVVVESDKPLVQLNEYVWGTQTLKYTECTELGCVQHYDHEIIDFEDLSVFDKDGKNTTSGQVEYSYSEETSKDKFNVTNFIRSWLKVLFISTDKLDPTITQTSSEIATGGHINHSSTRQSTLDNSITLNQSAAGEAIPIQPIDLGGNLTVQNVTTASRHDVQDGHSFITFTYEEGTGTPSSDDGDSPSITTVGTQTFVTSDVAIGEYSYNLSASSRYYTTSYDNRFNTSKHTMGVWIKTNSLGSNTVMYSSTSNGGARRFWIYENTDLIISYNGVGTTPIITNANITDGNWHFVVAVWNGTHARAYLDGEEHGSPESYTSLPFTTKTSNIGFNSYGGGTFPAGKKLVDSWFIYNDSISSAEVQDLYNATRSGYIDSLTNVTSRVRVSKPTSVSASSIPQSGSLVFEVTANNESEISSTAVMDNIGSNDLTIVGNAEHNVTGWIDLGMDNPGDTGDYFRKAVTGFRSADTSGTVSAWIKPRELTTMNFFTSSDEGSTGTFFAVGVASTGGLQVVQKNNGDTTDEQRTTQQLLLNEWNLVTVSSNGARYKMYVNGRESSFTTIGGSDNGDWFGDSNGQPRDNLVIGSLVRSSSVTPYNGSIDQVRVWSAELTAEEVFDLWQADYSKYHNKPAYTPPQNDSLVGFWSFDRYSQNFTHYVDSSSQSNAGLIDGNVFSIDGFIDTSGYFNTFPSGVQIPDIPAYDVGSDMTFSAWVKPYSVGVTQSIVAQFDSGADGAGWTLFMHSSNDLRFQGGNGVWNALSVDTVDTYGTDLMHVVATNDGTSWSIYVNGELAANASGGTIKDEVTNNLSIGRHHVGSAWNGTIDQVMLWNVSLSPSEIRELYEDQALSYGSWQTTYNTSNVTGRFVQYKLDFTSSDELFSEYVQNVSIGYETVSFGAGAPDTNLTVAQLVFDPIANNTLNLTSHDTWFTLSNSNITLSQAMNITFLNSQTLNKISGGGTTFVWVNFTIDGTTHIYETIGTMSSTESVVVGWSQPNTELSSGNHNLSLSYLITGGTGIVEVLHADVIGYAHTTNQLENTPVNRTFYSLNHSQTSPVQLLGVNPSSYNTGFLWGKVTMNKDGAGVREIDYFYRDNTADVKSPIMVRALEDATDVGSLVMGVFNFSQSNTDVGFYAQVESPSQEVTSNFTLLQFGTSDDDGDYVPFITRSKDATNRTTTESYSAGRSNIYNTTMTLQNGTALFYTFRLSAQSTSGAQTNTYYMNVTGTGSNSCQIHKSRSLSANTDVGNVYAFGLCTNLSVGQTYTVDLLVDVSAGETLSILDESVLLVESEALNTSQGAVIPPVTNDSISVGLVSPVNNSNVTSLTPTFTWNYTHGSGITGNCTLFINDTLGGDTSCLSGVNTNLVVNHTLNNISSYSWFIRARAGSNETNSSTFFFQTPSTNQAAGAGADQGTTSITEAFYLVLIGLAIIVVGRWLREFWIEILGYFYLFVIGVYFIISPITGFTSMVNLLFGSVLFGVGVYAWIKRMLDKVEETMG